MLLTFSYASCYLLSFHSFHWVSIFLSSIFQFSSSVLSVSEASEVQSIVQCNTTHVSCSLLGNFSLIWFTLPSKDSDYHPLSTKVHFRNINAWKFGITEMNLQKKVQEITARHIILRTLEETLLNISLLSLWVFFLQWGQLHCDRLRPEESDLCGSESARRCQPVPRQEHGQHAELAANLCQPPLPAAFP